MIDLVLVLVLYIYIRKYFRKHKGELSRGTKFYFFGIQSVFSNFYPCKFIGSVGILYNCVEQYIMYHKALIFCDYEIADKILEEVNPRSIKTLGRSVRNFVDSIWVPLRESVVLDALRLKFGQNLELRQALLST